MRVILDWLYVTSVRPTSVRNPTMLMGPCLVFVWRDTQQNFELKSFFPDPVRQTLDFSS